MKQVQELLSKQMTRKEFLKVAGLAIMSLFGVSNFITFLLSRSGQGTRNTLAQRTADSKASSAFGSRKFGV